MNKIISTNRSQTRALLGFGILDIPASERSWVRAQ